MKRILVYCGSAKGNDPTYQTSAIKLAQLLVEHNLGLVYGGGNVGLMGIIADEVLRLGGEVIGVIPRRLMEKEVGHANLTEMFIVEDMHQRKAKMFELSDACIALAGGIGTMEELFEAFTWSQLGFHQKPCGVLNTKGYYNALHQLMQHMVDSGFLKQQHKDQLIFETDEERLLRKLLSATNDFGDKWW
ncbi:MAG: TIGR00730 family Rossman fold protein [Bacteroidota bacterium]